LARVCRARSASVCAAVRTSHVNMRCPKRQARLVSERLIHKLAGLTALRPSQHCITNLVDIEMTGRTSTKVTQFLIQRWKIVNDSVFWKNNRYTRSTECIASKTSFHHIPARCQNRLVEHVKKDRSTLDRTPDYRQWFSFLDESSTNAQNWRLCEQNIIAFKFHTCSMLK
jgi:hypothetical protein